MTRSAFVNEWLKGKTLEDIAFIENGDKRPLWPVKIQRLRAGGKFEEEAAFVQVLDSSERMEAKRDALNFFKEQGFDGEDKEKTADVWKEIELFATISIALRKAKPNDEGIHQPLHSLGMLVQTKETGISLREVMNLREQLDIFTNFEDPRLDTLDVETVVEAAMAVAEKGNLSPLVAIVGPEVDTFVIGTCVILANYLMHTPLSPSAANSTKAPSSLKKSGGSSKAKPTKSPGTSTSDILASTDPTPPTP